MTVKGSTLGRAAIIVSLGILLSRVLGFARNVVLYGLLGRGLSNDLYQAAFSIPDWLFFMMAGGYLSITLVPILTRHHAEGDDDGARSSFTAVFRMVTGVMLVITVVMILAAGPITRTVFREFDAESLRRLTNMMRITFASQVFFVAGTLLMAAQYAVRRFVIPTLAPIVYNLGIILGGLGGALAGNPTPESFLWGGLAGAVVGNFALQWFGARRAGMRLRGGVPLRHPAISEYFVLALPLMIGQSAVALDEQWPRWFGQLADNGTISGLVAARQINMLPIGVIAQAAGVAAYPFLATLVSEGRVDRFRETVLRSVRSAVAVAGLAMAVVIPLALPLVRLAYQRGEFGPSDTRFVAPLLAIYALSIPLWAAHQVYTRGFYASRRMWLPVLIGSAVTLVEIPALFWGVTTLGGRGLAIISSASMLVYTLVIAGAFHRSGSTTETRGLVSAVARIAGATVVAMAVTWLATRPIGWETAGESLMSVGVGGVAGTVGYVLTARVLGVGEVEALVRRLLRR